MTAPPPSDTTPPRLEQLAHEALLALAKHGLALALEERGDGLPDLALDQLVGVFGLGAERPRRGSRGLALAGAHEADEDERYLCHPMRSA